MPGLEATGTQTSEPVHPCRKGAGRRRRSPRAEGIVGGSKRCSNQPEKAASDDGWAAARDAHRRRQACVAAILDRTFGRSAHCSPDLWDRRAYLMLVGLVYERLATNEDEISTDELIALAKVLAENRRVEARLRENQPQEQPTETEKRPPGTLPTGLTDAVRQVYGTNVASAHGDST